MSPSALIVRKESGELLVSARGLAWLLALSAMLSVFSLLLVSNTELSLLDNAQAVHLMMGTVVALGALLATVLGADAIAGEKERATLVPLLLAPLSSGDLVAGKIGGQALAWLVAYVIALPYLWAVGSTGQNLAQAIGYLALFGTPVVLGFGFYAIGLSARFGSVRAALTVGLITLIVLGGPMLLGPSLRQSALGRAFDAIDPFAAALNSFDSAVIDSEPLRMQLVRLAVALAWLLLTAWFAKRSVERLEI
jgi:ABC-type transport system involved in multi-copper enzyme maturation permease subunit